MEAFITLIAIAFAVVLIAIPISIARAREADRIWMEAATKLGLRFTPRALFAGRRMEGSLRGYRVKVDTFTRSHGKSSTTYTRFRIQFPRSLGLGLELTREGFFSGFAKKFGVQDIQVGDAVFDPDVMVKGTDPERVIRYLTRARRTRIHRFLTSHDGATIGDHGIKWQTRGVIRSARSIESALTAMTKLAWHLTGERKEDLRMERALVERIAGRPTEALAILEEDTEPVAPEASPPDGAIQETVEATAPEEEPPSVELETRSVEERFLEGELLNLAGREEEARARFREALEAAPEDPEIREWVERPSVPAPEHEAEAASEVAPERGDREPVPAEATPALDVASVCNALFAPTRSSYQANQAFESKYRGREIRWTGVLREVEPYSFDVVFGSEAGARAVIEVFETETGFLGESQVHAVVQLAPDRADALEQRKGREITVAGRLEKVDVVMRNIYVTRGAILDNPA